MLATVFGIQFTLLATPTLAQGGDSSQALWAQATLYRDEWGIPHVYATNPRAMAFGFGYAQADDHIETMLASYFVANGRGAEIYGESYADSDEFALKMGHGSLAQAAYPGLDALTRDLCEGFALGINAWLADHPDKAPLWAEGVQPTDILALMHAYLSGQAPFDLPNAFRPPAPALSGNAWAIGPKRSSTGEPMLFVNPHEHWDGVYRWYEAHLVAPGYNVYGATLFGLPVIVQGHNEVLAWAMTPNYPDTADVYIEPTFRTTSDPKDINSQDRSAELRAMLALGSHVKPATYYVTSAAGMERREVATMMTPRGPYIGSQNGRRFSYKVGGYGEFGALVQLANMGSARSMTEFQNALSLRQLPSFHIVSVDREGTLFYLYNAKVGAKEIATAIQDAGVDIPGITTVPIDWGRPVPGDKPAYAWKELIPLEALPSVTNPPSGYIQICGNPPWTVADQSGISAEAWPAWFIGDRDTYRARRARQLLNMGKRTFVEAQGIAYDVLTPFAMTAVPQLLTAARERPDVVASLHPDLPAGLGLLEKWNYVAEPSSEGMTFFHVWWAAFRAMTPAAMPEKQLFAAFDQKSPELQESALKAASEAAKLLRNEFQTVGVPWGQVHFVRRGDALVPLPGALSGEPIFAASDLEYGNKQWRATYGYGFGMVVKLGVLPEAVTMSPFGSSEDPDSPHYDDQLPLMAERRFKVAHYTTESVQTNTATAYGRNISLRPEALQALFTIAAEKPVTARLVTGPNPPDRLPERMAPFTIFVQPQVVPLDARVQVQIELYIPPELCPNEQLAMLALGSYDRRRGWARVETQAINPQTRMLTATDDSARIYAVLMPDTMTPLGQLEARRNPEVEEVAQDDGFRARRAPVPWPTEGVEEIAPFEFPEGAGLLEEAIAKHEADMEAANNEALPETAPLETESADTTDAPGVEPADAPSVEIDSAPEDATPEPTGADAPVEAPDPSMAPAETEKPEDSNTPDAPAPSPSTQRQASIGWGRTIELHPPGMNALVEINCETTIGARLSVAETTPVELPADLAAFTPFITTETSNAEAPTDITMMIQTPDSVCDDENLGQLSLYASDPKTGWTKLESTREEGSRIFRASDTAPRTYAVLGPKSVRKQ